MKEIERALKVIKVKEFIQVATADKVGKPNSAPKLLLKIDNIGTVYFIDYSIGKTAENLRVNPEVSLSFIDLNSLFGYRLNGRVEIIEKGKIYDECLKELREKEINLSVDRVIQGLHHGKSHKDFESENSARFLLYKVKIEEGCEITPHGIILRERSSSL